MSGSIRLALIGCGLVGGSLAAAWHRAGCVRTVVGFDQDPARAGQGVALGIFDSAAPSLAHALAGADAIVLATPVGAMGAVLAEVARHARPDAVVTDVGSTKGGVIEHARAALGDGFARFVPAHPIAGGALPGIENASADLFAERWVVTTPQPETDARALQWVEDNWRASGAMVERMAAPEHDRIFAAVSHLPHVLAFALVDLIAAAPDGLRKLQFAGAGFRDFSRIAASDPVMWRDIALANGAALGAELAAFRRQLDHLQTAVDAADADALRQLFERASRVRREQRFGAAVQNGYGD
jgi:prephenate dehydrogenase